MNNTLDKMLMILYSIREYRACYGVDSPYQKEYDNQIIELYKELSVKQKKQFEEALN